MKRLAFWCAALVVLVGGTVSSQQRPLVLGLTPVPVSSSALFDDRVVQDIRLNVNSEYWQTLKDRYLEDTYYPADFQWRTLTVRNVGIRSRGTGSRSGTKPGLKVDFSEYVKGQTFLGLKSLVLRNNTQDPSNLHERVSMRLFDRMDLAASREAHARLFVNGQYAGLYTVVEPIDKVFLSRVYDDNRGYLFEYEYLAGAAPYRFEYLGSDPRLYVPVSFKPQTHEEDPRPEFVERLIWTIGETSSATFRTAIADVLDLPRFLRHVAVENFVADTDGLIGDYGMNNFYLYRFDNGTRFDFIPWDKSEAFKGGSAYGIFHNVFDVPEDLRNRLLSRALAYADLRDLYLDALLACAQVADERGPADGAGWLEREITFAYQQVRAFALADPVKPFTNEQFEQDARDVLTFARERGGIVSRAVADARPAINGVRR